MISIKTLLPELKKLVTDLSEDLLARSTDDTEIDAGLREAYTQIEKGGRTGDPFEVWREDYLDQVAVAWVLACVFVRFMEDNHLIDECWLAGEGDRRTKAENEHELYFRAHPKESDREYFEHVFHEVGKIPACHDLFAEGKTPLWAVGPSGDAAMKLLAFWREIDTDSGHLKRTFDVKDGDTRFLGDLYQDLSERARKKYALLQTPVFVEEFILDRTLDPAIDEFGLDEVRMIDATCGSGHFLLGGFGRLFKLWSSREDNDRVAAQKALDGIWGVDINPFAVAIARFRLIVAAIQACEINRLKDAPGWTIHLATGDSLLFGNRWDQDGKKKSEQQFLGTAEESWAPDIYACEDKDAISEILGQQYHAVVGNPPYITVSDRSLNTVYRERYSSCHQKYSLSVPFAERFFDLANRLSEGIRAAGFVGMITSNSFMKRTFGKKLIEDFFQSIDLTHIVDTSGAFIPGHGTPTVILYGRNRGPVSPLVRVVMCLKGEPVAPQEPAEGLVWNSLVTSIDLEAREDEFASSMDIERSRLGVHPWTFGGGAVDEVFATLNNAKSISLDGVSDSIGITCFTLEDDVFIIPQTVARRLGIDAHLLREMVIGESIRDWIQDECDPAIFPYDTAFAVLQEEELGPGYKYLWRYRTTLGNNKMFGAKTKLEAGLQWYEYGRLTYKKLRTPLSIVFAAVATHNHFVLDRGGRLFKQSVIVIKLNDDASEEDHLRLLGLLNSSTAAFWMKQVFYPKSSAVNDISTEKGKPESNRYDFAATGMKAFPVPMDALRSSKVLEIAREIDRLASEMRSLLPGSVIEKWETGQAATDLSTLFTRSENKYQQCKRRAIALQEELDWEVYQVFGLSEVGASSVILDKSEIGVGSESRPFLWNVENESSDVPQECTALYRDRKSTVAKSRLLRTVETLVFKRPWWGRQGVYGSTSRTYTEWINDACQSWMHEFLETAASGVDGKVQLMSVAEIADKINANSDFMSLASIYRGREDFGVAALVSELIESESVPCLPVLRYKPSGLRKRAVWESVWAQQRREDIGEAIAKIKVPPKYTSSDFQRQDFWRLRGKQDVPKERWVSFLHCERDGDDSLVVGWAGWNHLQLATAIVAYYDARKNEGWTAERLKPLLAAIDELLPWIHQWHPEIDPEYNETAGTSFQTLLESESQELGLTLEDIRSWTPPKKTARRKRKKASS